MKIDVERFEEVDLLKLSGRLDASSAGDLKDQAGKSAEEGRVNVVMDMAEIDFIDSSGLGSLVSALRSVNKLGGEIKLSCLQDPVRAIFELTRLHRIFEIFDSSEDAIKSFQ